MAQSMHIAFESRREHRRTECWTDYRQKMISPALNGGWPASTMTSVTAALERTRRRTVGSYSRSPALWMNVAPSEWSVSVPAMPTHGSRRDPELPGSLVHACVRECVRATAYVRRNREHEDRWLICTRFTYARAGCYSFVGTREMDHRHRNNSRDKSCFHYRDSPANRKHYIFIFGDEELSKNQMR